MFWPTMTIPLDHLLGAEAEPQIERKLWKAWAFGTPGEFCVHELGSGSTTPATFARTRL
jgi:hypothetical protein